MRRRVLIATGTRNRKAGLARLLRSIVAHTTDALDWRIYIADASDAGQVTQPDDVVLGSDLCLRLRHTCVLVREWPRLGFGPGLNALIGAACTHLGKKGWEPEFVVWLNDDATVEPGWLEAAVATLERWPQAGMAALPYLTPHAPDGWHVNAWPRPNLLYANFGILRVPFFHAIGGFDLRVKLYGGDNALAFRVLGAGQAIVPVPHRCIVHHFAEDAARAGNAAITRADWSAVQPEYFSGLHEYEAVQHRLPSAVFDGFRSISGGIVLDETPLTTYAQHCSVEVPA